MGELLRYTPPGETEGKPRREYRRPSPEPEEPSDEMDGLTVFDVQRDAMRTEVARDRAKKVAEAREPNADEAAERQLRELKQRLEESDRAYAELPKWKKWFQSNDARMSLAKRVAEQEDVVRDLKAVYPADELERAADALSRSRTAGETKRFEERVGLALKEVAMATGLRHVITGERVPYRAEDREKIRAGLRQLRALTGSTAQGSVTRKWVDAGLKALAAYERVASSRPEENGLDEAIAAK